MRYGERYRVGPHWSTVLAGFDFETYSEAGYVFDGRSWRALKAGKPGIAGVGSWAYAQHASTFVHVLRYDLHDGVGCRQWHPGESNPEPLFAHVRAGLLLEAINGCDFEWPIWEYVCRRLYDWPALPRKQLYDVSAKCAAHTLPRGLDHAAQVVGSPIGKDLAGHRVMRRVSVPRTPTQKDRRLRYTRDEDPGDFAILDAYCGTDVAAEDEVSMRVPDLSPFEQHVALISDRINARGVYVDPELVDCASDIVAQAETRYNLELCAITSGAVTSSDKLPALKEWLYRAHGVYAPSITVDILPELLADPTIPAPAHRALEIRELLGSKSVTKTAAMRYQRVPDNRLRGLYTYCGALRTRRFSGNSPQPHNLPKEGPPVVQCVPCGAVHWAGLNHCPACFGVECKPTSWGIDASEACLHALRSRNLTTLELLWGDPLTAIAGCLRSFFMAGPGCELICSDFSAIEAMITAALAGEQWRLDVFRTHGKIYEASAASCFSVPFEEILQYKRDTGMHHPLRAKGKIAELASGFSGWIGAWRKFGATGTDDEIGSQVVRWRDASPMIVNLWKGTHAAAISAVKQPGQCFSYRQITYQLCDDGVLYCHLPSGRAIPYHGATVREELRYDRVQEALFFYGWKKGHWIEISAWRGLLTENYVQALARDIFVECLVRLEAHGYPIVLHTHDEPCAEVPIGTGSIEHFEQIAGVLPAWCADWPIKISGGWRGLRYRKD